MSNLSRLKARWLILHNDTFCSLEIAEHFIATIASQKLSTEIEQPGDFEYAYDEFIKLAREAAKKIAAVNPTKAMKLHFTNEWLKDKIEQDGEDFPETLP